MEIHLTPHAKGLTIHDNDFRIDEETPILIPAPAGDDRYRAALQIQDEVRAATGLSLPIIKAFAPLRNDNTIQLICGEDEAALFDIRVEGELVPGNHAHWDLVVTQAYALTVTSTGVILYADSSAGLFYAIQTLRQLVRLHGRCLPSLTIRDWPSLPHRGVLLDISRRKVPRLDTLKHLVSELSSYKLNVLQLYTEHTFQFPSHPLIGAGCGSLTSQDILDLDAHCRTHHVELMPNLQSFGHARNTLLLPEYQHLAESDLLWTLSPASEGTYDLLDDLYAGMLPAFTSTTLNVDCDETYDLGQGASKPLADEFGVGRIYLNHILRVRELAARYGRRIQVWGDILLNHPDLIGEVPDDITLLDWRYGPAEAYPSVEVFAKAGRRFWICPGVGSWNSIFPRLDGARINIRNFVRDGAAAGAEGMLNTDWGDFGHYQPLGLSWHGYVFGAAQAWTGGLAEDADFDAAFGPLFFGPEYGAIMRALHELAHINDLPGVHRPNRSHTVLALFDEPLTGLTVTGEDALPGETLDEMYALAQQAADTLDALAPGHPREQTLREMASAAHLTAYAARKVMLSQTIRRELGAPDLTATCIYRHMQELEKLSVELEELQVEFKGLWLARARRSEIHVVLGYYAALRTRFQAAIDWLAGLRQSLLMGGTVDADLETYDVGGYRVLWQTWPEM